MIWFYANENKNICKFYEETIQDKIPLVLVSNGENKGDTATKDESASTEKAFFVNPLKDLDIEKSSEPSVIFKEEDSNSQRIIKKN